ncbi:hypothetical protein Hanom_Chr17g01527851 [Helianthus anomalus]
MVMDLMCCSNRKEVMCLYPFASFGQRRRRRRGRRVGGGGRRRRTKHIDLATASTFSPRSRITTCSFQQRS